MVVPNDRQVKSGTAECRKRTYILYYVCNISKGLHSSAATAIRYELDGPGIESHPASYAVDTGSLSRG